MFLVHRSGARVWAGGVLMPAATATGRPDEAPDGTGLALEETFLRHPRFAQARNDYVRGYLGIYDGPEPLNRLMIRAARHLIIRFIVCLAATQDPKDRSTWLTRARLKEYGARYQTASKGQVDAVVGRMLVLGLLDEVRAPAPSTLRLLKPTPALLDHDVELHVAQARPLTLLSQSQAVEMLASHDPAMQVAMRAASLAAIDRSHMMLAGHPEILSIIRREAGGLILYKLLDLARHAPDGATVADLNVADLARHFGVSSVHVRSLLRDAQVDGFLMVTEGRGRTVGVVFKPAFLCLCDRWFASVMALFHDCCEVAWAEVAKAP